MINRSDAALSRVFETDMAPGMYCDVLDRGDRCSEPDVTVAADGSAEITLPASSALAIHVEARVRH